MLWVVGTILMEDIGGRGEQTPLYMSARYLRRIDISHRTGWRTISLRSLVNIFKSSTGLCLTPAESPCD